MTQVQSEQAANVVVETSAAVEVVDQPTAKVVIPELQSKEAIKKRQDSFKRRLASLDTEAHSIALQCLIHASIHRDTSLMRRFVVDILDVADGKNGYRVRGLIAWMRVFSPMELKGKDINLSGKLTAAGKKALIEKFPGINLEHHMEVGAERPFLIEQAMNTPLWEVSREAAIVKPVFRDTLMSPINTAMKNFRAAVDNTDSSGRPIDPEKPYYNGTNSQKVVDFFAEVERLQSLLPADDSKVIHDATEKLREATGNNPDALAAACRSLTAV